MKRLRFNVSFDQILMPLFPIIFGSYWKFKKLEKNLVYTNCVFPRSRLAPEILIQEKAEGKNYSPRIGEY